jgi:hypothetical protein
MTLPGSESLPSTAAMIAELDQIMILGYAAPERKRELVFSPKFADEDANYGRLCSSARRRLDFVSQEHFKFITRRCTEEHTCNSVTTGSVSTGRCSPVDRSPETVFE